MQTIKCGVLKVPFLALFFILYINDLPNASELVELLVFVDDTSIFYSHSNPNTLKSLLVWLACYKLSLNLKKTTYLHNFFISLCDQLLTQSNTTKFLGVYIDEHLTWKDHNYQLFM